MTRISLTAFVVLALAVPAAADARANAPQADEARTHSPGDVVEPPTAPEPDRPVRKSRLADRREGDLPVNYELDVSHVPSPPAQKDNCLRHTGSRLRRAARPDGQGCSGAPGRVYLREDLDADGNMKRGRR